MSKRQKYFLIGPAVLILSAIAVIIMAVHDQDGVPGEGWTASPLLRFINSDPICKWSQYSGGNMSCLTAYDKEVYFAEVMLLVTLLVVIGCLIYWVKQWRKKKSHSL